jgi:type II secretory pathway pseudopilin PulG
MSTPNSSFELAETATSLSRFSWTLRERGLSLVELIMFIVIVGAAVAGIIAVISRTTQSSADPMVRKQALSIAEAVLEEVRLQPFTYCDPDDPTAATATLGSGAAMAFVASADAGRTSLGDLTINKPTGTVENNVMVASIGFRINSPGQYSTDVGVTAPAGWTLVRRLDNLNSSGSGLAIYQKVAGASEPASYAWTFSCINVSGGNTCVNLGFNAAAGGILTFSGVDTTSPIDAENGAPTPVATTTPATPSITTTVPNTMLVSSHTLANSDAWANPPTSGMTQAFQRTTGIEMIQVSYAVQASAGATGTKTATDLGPEATDHGNTHILALKPGGGCPVLTEAMGPEPGETRYSSALPFDNVNDYHGFDSNTAVPSGIRNIDGTAVAGLDGYRITVSVEGQTFGGIGNDAAGNPQSLLITVTVTGPGNTTVTLNGYRTRYAPNALP